jgi:hypothetical protein
VPAQAARLAPEVRAADRLAQHQARLVVAAQALPRGGGVAARRALRIGGEPDRITQPLGDALHVGLDGELGLGAPKPRKAPLGGVLVLTTRPVMVTFGQR